MEKQGRKTAEKITNLDKFRKEKNKAAVKIPVGMTPRSRTLFKKIVAEYQTGTINSEAVTLLRAFCEAEEQRHIATQELNKSGAVINVSTKAGVVPRRNPWFDISKESASLMNSLSTKIRKMGLKADGGAKAQSARVGLMFGDKK